LADPKLEEAKRIMGALLRMPPKPHDEMKLGKPRRKQPMVAAAKKPRKKPDVES
jgi:hypothetical protein